MVVIFFGWPSTPNKQTNKQTKKTVNQGFNFFNTLLFHFFTLLCALWRQELQSLHYRELFIKKNNQKKEKSISDLLVMARRKRVAFSLSLASSSSELMNTRMTSLESSPPPESMALMSYSSLSLSSFSLLSALALLSFCVSMLAFLSVCWSVLRGFFCCKHECLTIAFTFSLLLLFKCCFSV